MTSILEPAKDGGARTGTEGRPGGGGPTRHLRVAVIGTGFSGLGTAIRLLQSGIDDFLVFERADEVGGTWRDNSYPGCACDVMSHLYSFSFARNPNWKSTFASRDELYAYLRETADRFGVRPHIRFGHELEAARWDEGERHWRIETSQGQYTAQFLVTGTGYLSEAAVPDIKGLAEFEGKVFHSSNWDHDHDLAGRRVAVIGTGASAIQFVPAIQPEVGHLDLYQRTPAWIGPKPDKVNSARHTAMLRSLPGYQQFRRGFNMWGREILAFFWKRPKLAEKVQKMASDHLEKSVADEALRKRLTPDYLVACKRLLFSNTWYPAIQQPNVEIVTEGIAEVRAKSIVGSDGVEREVDTIILGTGFQATDRPVARRIWGRGGAQLREVWKDGMSAHRGTTVAGFPNLFMLLGPNTALGHSSQTVMIEAQVRYVVDSLKQVEKRGLASIEVRQEAQDAYNRRLDEHLEGTVWMSGGCRSWYLDANGRNTSIFPTYTWRFRRGTKRLDLSEYQLASQVRSTKPVPHQ
ncbi:flavin-containing monooxygenase [Streptomyces avidinii]|uniref:flavin-containing monooxygenase n=1 Tax=Streptomyces avidinii TaxID=1895 RepID=UPI0037BB7B5C|nr:NAD(P)/FAD-dependent oxidoreductase [Streptomyces avidinii]WST49961.1 NAD(P)/FAD-dependent oxidoreductase [Streptomyces avidinii]